MKTIIACLLVFFLVPVTDAQTASIVNKLNVTKSVTREEIKAIFLMRTRRWDDGNGIIIYQMPHDSKQHRMFLKDIMNLSSERYNREWDRLMNSGKSSLVKFVNTETEMVQRISLSPNAIGYIDSDHIIINAGNKDIKILKVTE